MSSYIEEVYAGTNKTFNCIFFQPSTLKETYEVNEAVKKKKNISRNCNGRFHWVNSEGKGLKVYSESCQISKME